MDFLWHGVVVYLDRDDIERYVRHRIMPPIRWERWAREVFRFNTFHITDETVLLLLNHVPNPGWQDIPEFVLAASAILASRRNTRQFTLCRKGWDLAMTWGSKWVRESIIWSELFCWSTSVAMERSAIVDKVLMYGEPEDLEFMCNHIRMDKYLFFIDLQHGRLQTLPLRPAWMDDGRAMGEMIDKLLLGTDMS